MRANNKIEYRKKNHHIFSPRLLFFIKIREKSVTSWSTGKTSQIRWVVSMPTSIRVSPKRRLQANRKVRVQTSHATAVPEEALRWDYFIMLTWQQLCVYLHIYRYLR